MKTFNMDSDVFVQSVEETFEIIEWTFAWNGVIYMNKEFKELIIDNYCNN